MNRLFDINNPFFRFMSKFFDIMVLSIVFVIFFVLLLIIGLAITALYYFIAIAVIRDRSYPVKEFFHAFKRDFRQSAIVGIIILAISAIIVVDIRIVIGTGDAKLGSLKIAYVVVALLIAFISTYIFPLISRFSLKMKDLFKLAFFLSFKHFLSTILCVLILAAGVVGVFVSMGLFLLFIPGLVALLISFPMEKVLKKTLEQIGTGTDHNADQWYAE